MGFAYSTDLSTKLHITLTDEPEYIVPLEMAPNALEAVLHTGKWLVVSISLWSIHDSREGGRAIRLAKQFSGKFNLGLRPYDYPAEFATWLPGVKLEEQISISFHNENGVRHVMMEGNRKASPVWAVFKEGQLQAIELGCLTDDALEELVTPLIEAT